MGISGPMSFPGGGSCLGAEPSSELCTFVSGTVKKSMQKYRKRGLGSEKEYCL